MPEGFLFMSLMGFARPYLMKDMEKSSREWEKQWKWGKYSCFLVIMMSMELPQFRFFLSKNLLSNVATISGSLWRYEFRLKNWLCWWQWIFTYHSFGLCIKSIDHVRYARSKKHWFHHLRSPQTGNSCRCCCHSRSKRDDCSYPYDELCGCGIGLNWFRL
jgi:hypothetical protein